MPDATDSEFKQPRAEVVVPSYVDNKDPLSVPVDPGRVNQQQLLPAAAQARILGSIIGSSTGSTAQGSGFRVSGVIPDATSGVFRFITADNRGRILIGVPDVSIFVSSVSAVNQWPTASVGGGNLPVYVMNDWAQTNNANVVTRVIVRNNTGSPQTIIVVCRTRLITNPVATSGLTNT